MARIRHRLHYSDTRAELVEHKDAKRGAMEDAFWDEDELVDYRAKRKKRGRPKKQRGCPENNYGPHVYVWVPSGAVYSWWPEYVDNFYEENGFHRREYKTCCGCGKTNGSRYTEEMQKKINRHGWYKANYGD